MSILQHLVRADAGRFRVLIAVWIIVVIAATVLAGVDPFVVRDPELRPVFGLGMLVESLAGMALAVTLIALVVQQHPLVGSDAWWMTRPVAPRTLLGSRLMLIGLLVVVVPAICDAVLMAVYRVPAGQMARVTLEWLLLRGVGMLLVMAAAAVTKTFARFVLLVGACLIAAAVVINLALVIAVSDARAVLLVSTDFAATLISRPPDPTGLVAAWLVFAAAGVLLLRSQYTTRSRLRSVMIGIAGSFLAVVVGISWPWPLLHAQATPIWAASPDALRLEVPSQGVYFDNAGIQVGDVQAGDPPRWRTAHVRMYVRGVPDGWLATAHVREAVLDFEGGRLTSGPVRYSVTLPASSADRSPMRRTLQHVLRVDVVAGRSFSSGGLAPILAARSTEVPAGTGPATYRGEFVLDLLEPQEAGALPLRSGAVFQDGSYRLVVDEVQSRERGALVRVRISSATSVYDRRPPPTFTFYLRNRSAGEAVVGTVRQSRNFSHFPGQFFLGSSGYFVSPYGFIAQAAELSFPSTVAAQLPSAMSKSPGGEWTDDAWLRGAELVIVKTIEAGSVTRRIEVAGLTINPTP